MISFEIETDLATDGRMNMSPSGAHTMPDVFTKEKRSEVMSHIRSKDTAIEVRLRKALWHKGYRYRKNWKKLPGKPDIALAKYRIAVFCDSEFFHGKDWEELQKKVLRSTNGEYWYRHIKSNIDRDAAVDETLRKEGWTVLRFWGKDIEKHLDDCVRAVDEAVSARKAQEGKGSVPAGLPLCAEDAPPYQGG